MAFVSVTRHPDRHGLCCTPLKVTCSSSSQAGVIYPRLGSPPPATKSGVCMDYLCLHILSEGTSCVREEKAERGCSADETWLCVCTCVCGCVCVCACTCECVSVCVKARASGSSGPLVTHYLKVCPERNEILRNSKLCACLR